MKMDSKTIIYLLSGGHINIQERTEMGIWPYPPLTLNDLALELTNYVKGNRWFPQEWVERSNGEIIDNVTVIEKLSDNEFLYRSRRANPRDITLIASRTEKTFNSAEEVADYYLRTALGLPGRLDKWKVVE